MIHILTILYLLSAGWQGTPRFGPNGERLVGSSIPQNAVGDPVRTDTVPSFRPSVQIDDNSLAYCRGPFMHVLDNNIICAILQSGPSGGYPRHIRFTRSLDTGRVWLKPNVIIRYDPDTIILYPSMTVDGRGGINVVWCEPYVGGIQFSRSTNGGATWSSRVRVDDGSPSGYSRLNPDITGAGTVLYASWMESPSSPQNWAPWVKRSTDAGATWTGECQITGLPPSNTTLGRPYTRYDARLPRWYVMWVGTDGEVRVARSSDGTNWQFSIVTIDNVVDAKYASMALGPGGNLYVVWTEARYGQYDTDIFIGRSTDGGVTWGASVLVNDRAGIGANQYEPHIAVDKKGYLHVSWIECVPFGQMTHAYYTISTDDGDTWLNPNLTVTDLLSTITPNVPYSISIAPDTTSYAYIGWVYMFGSSSYNYFATNCPPVVKIEEDGGTRSLAYAVKVFPNPSNGPTTIRYAVAGRIPALRIYNVSGQLVRSLDALPPVGHSYGSVLWDGRDDDGRRVPAGVYSVRLSADGCVESQTLLLIR